MRIPVGSPAPSRSTRPPGGSGVWRSIAGQPERRRARPDRVAVDADQRHRVIGRGAIERGARRVLAARPAVLVPPAPGDPLARPRAGGARRDARRARPPRTAAPRRRASGGSRARCMRWPWASTRPGSTGRPPRSISGSPSGRADVGAPARVDDAALAHHEGVDDTVRGVERVDPAVGQEHGALAYATSAAVGVAGRARARRARARPPATRRAGCRGAGPRRWRRRSRGSRRYRRATLRAAGPRRRSRTPPSGRAPRPGDGGTAGVSSSSSAKLARLYPAHTSPA